MLALLALVACDDFLARRFEPEVALEPVVVARLNRTEYDNSVRDLFGTTLRPSVDFPSDDFGYGFDNIADVLSVSPLHVELYQRAAHELVAELYGQRSLAAQRWLMEAENAESTGGADYEATAWVLYGDDEVYDRVTLTESGSYTVATMVWTHGGAPATLALLVDGEEQARATVTVEQRVEATLDLAAGPHTIAVVFLDPEAARDVDEDLVVDWLELTGPLGKLAPPPAGRDRVLSCAPGDGVTEAACVEQIVRDFGRRAWRRPLSRTELDEQLGLYGAARATGASFDEGVAAALEGLLMSPHFIYKVELDPASTDGVHPVGSYELATRLSYFLWSTTPDDQLLDLAASGVIQQPDVLRAEALRMLADPRARALVDNLGGQWLGIRAVESSTFDPALFPEADVALLRAMEDEMAALVGDVFLRGAPMSDLFTTTRATLDDRLARHYGLPAGGEVDLPDRPGLLSRGGFLSSTSYPTRTSPVRRGVWVLDKVLCSPPPPAPAGIPALEESGGASVLEQLAQHRADPSCAACHDAMDPIGIALEGFDPLGRVRSTYEDGQPVIDDAVLPTGEAVSSAAELVAALARDPRVASCAVDKTLTYALGRAPASSDDALVQELVDVVRDTDSFHELVLAIVQSEPFRFRRGER